jgi:predicted amidohydrolase
VDAGEGERWVTLDVDVAEVRAWREAFPALKDRREGWTR